MKKRIITGIIVLLLAALGMTGWYLVATTEESTPQRIVEKAKPELSKYEVGPPDKQELLELVNAERAKVGVAPLKIDLNVQKTAQLKADDFVARNYFAHHIKGTDKVLTPEMNDLLNLSCVRSSENIQITQFGNSQDAFNWWKDSTPHYTAMVDPAYTHTGFGIAHADSIDVDSLAGAGNYSDTYHNAEISVEHFCVAK